MSKKFLAYRVAAAASLVVVALSGCGPVGTLRVLPPGQSPNPTANTTKLNGDVVVANEILARFTVGAESLKGALPEGTLIPIYPTLHIYRIVLPQGQDLQKAISDWSQVPEAIYVEPNRVHQLVAPSSFSLSPAVQMPQLKTKAFSPRWDLVNINVSSAWAITKGDPNLVVAVIDTGIDPNHPNFGTRLLPMIDEIGTDTFTDSQNANHDFTGKDGNGHGTHVAGTIAGAIDTTNNIAGVAPNIKVLPIKVFNSSGSGSSATITKAIQDAVNKNVKLINMSLGGPVDDQTQHDAINNAIAQGVTFVISTGNLSATRRQKVQFPAAYAGVIAVGASSINNKVAYYSNFGPEIFVTAPGGGSDVDGVNTDLVTSTWPTYQTASDISNNVPAHSTADLEGTSMAAPHVTGAVALLLSKNSNLSPAQIRVRVGNSVNAMVNATGFDENAGYGQIDVLKLLSQDAP